MYIMYTSYYSYMNCLTVFIPICINRYNQASIVELLLFSGFDKENFIYFLSAFEF